MRHLPLLLLIGLTAAVSSPARDVTVYIGTFTNFAGRDTGSHGLYLGHMDSETGKLGAFTLAAEGANPSFLAFAPDHKHLYATSEVATTDGRPAGAVYAFAVNPADGSLKLLNRASAGGPGPTHIAVDPSGRTVMVANYDNGSIAALLVQRDGSLGDPVTYIQHKGKSVDPKRQDHAYAHSVNFSPDGRFVFSDDLGTDKLYGYSIDAATGAMGPLEPSSVSVKPGSGPRHLALHPDGRHAYVITEMASTIITFDYDAAHGSFTETQTVTTLPPDFTGTNSGAEIAVHPSGKFVYGSNRGQDAIALFKVDAANGHLTFVETVSTQGKTPRYFGIDPSGRWLIAANQNSNSLVVFRIDPATGRLSPAGATVELPAPVCVLFGN
jgi:6-phosphogluconolactonase